MTVAELRKALRGVNPDASVIINVDYGHIVLDTDDYACPGIVEGNVVRSDGSAVSFVRLRLERKGVKR